VASFVAMFNKKRRYKTSLIELGFICNLSTYCAWRHLYIHRRFIVN